MKITNWMIVDRSHLYRKGLADYIKQTEMNSSIDQSISGREAFNKLLTAQPTIVIANVNVETMDGIEMFKTIRHRGIHHHIFVFVSEIHWIENTYCRFANHLLWHLKESGVKYISTKEEMDESALKNVFQSIEKNKTYISPAILQAFNSTTKEDYFISSKMRLLSEREMEYLLHFANHKLPHEIASAMNIGTNTVNSFREKVIDKFELNNVSDLKRFCSAYHLFNLNNDNINPPPLQN